jgi:hypothetical protein
VGLQPSEVAQDGAEGWPLGGLIGQALAGECGQLRAGGLRQLVLLLVETLFLWGRGQVGVASHSSLPQEHIQALGPQAVPARHSCFTLESTAQQRATLEGLGPKFSTELAFTASAPCLDLSRLKEPEHTKASGPLHRLCPLTALSRLSHWPNSALFLGGGSAVVILGIELKASHLLGRCSTTSVTPPALFCFIYYSDRVSCFCLGRLQIVILLLLPRKWITGMSYHVWDLILHLIIPHSGSPTQSLKWVRDPLSPPPPATPNLPFLHLCSKAHWLLILCVLSSTDFHDDLQRGSLLNEPS